MAIGLVLMQIQSTPLVPPSSSLLAPPPNPKSFFTSPPPSPPPGWEPSIEPPPVVNAIPLDMMLEQTAMRLQYLEVMAAHNDLPSIVIEDVDFTELPPPPITVGGDNDDDDSMFIDIKPEPKSRIPQTRRPPSLH